MPIGSPGLVLNENPLWGNLLLLCMVGGVVLSVVLAIAGAFLAELPGPWRRWAEKRNPFTDAKQTEYVRLTALRLNSRKRENRIEALKNLGDLNDVSAVPALLKAVEKYHDDTLFLIGVIETLRKLEDARALPTLRRLRSGEAHVVMKAAQKALEAIEPKNALLRAACAPSQAQSAILLRPASPTRNTEGVNQLLRASQPDPDTI